MRPTYPLSPAIRTGPRVRDLLGSRYASRGLRQVMQRAGAEYRELMALAERVRELVRLPALPSRSELAVPGESPDPFMVAEWARALQAAVCPVTAITPSPFKARMRITRSPRPAAGRHVILFLAANPSETTRLALDEECAAIERELRMTTCRDDFDFRSRWAVSVDEVMRALNELQPTIIHFSGHGGGSAGVYVYDAQRKTRAGQRDVGVVTAAGITEAGIQLEGEQHQLQHVSARALTQMIASAAPSARLVVLNACFTDTVAEALGGVVDCVVGMRGAIGDDAARSFAVGFYRALGHRRSVGNAVEQAVATLAAKQPPDEHLPMCCTRDGVSADEITLLPLAPNTS